MGNLGQPPPCVLERERLTCTDRPGDAQAVVYELSHLNGGVRLDDDDGVDGFCLDRDKREPHEETQ